MEWRRCASHRGCSVTTEGTKGRFMDGSKMTVAWRAYAAGLLAIIAFFVVKVYDRVDRTAELVNMVERSVTALNGRLDAQAERLSDHDRRIGRLETPYFAVPERRSNP